jgi:hypothetical protein
MKLAEAINDYLAAERILGLGLGVSEGLVEEVILPRLQTSLEAHQAGDGPQCTIKRRGRTVVNPDFPRAFALFFKNIDL